MKWMVIILVLCGQVCYGQNWNEWTRQKKTQKKYLLLQIEAFKMYSAYLGKGYSVTDIGLRVIGDLKRKNFEQDEKYIESFKNVSTRVKGYRKVAEIAAIHLSIAKAIDKSISGAGNGRLTNNELKYLVDVYVRVRNDCERDVDRLIEVVTNSKLEMSDDERIKAIDRLYDAAIDQQSFVQSFSASVMVVVVQRMKESIEVNHSKKLNGIK
jgi:hypothetical protein